MSYPPLDMQCQNGRKRTWAAGVVTPRGRMYLCNPCASDVLYARKNETPWYLKLLDRAFNKVSAVA